MAVQSRRPLELPKSSARWARRSSRPSASLSRARRTWSVSSSGRKGLEIRARPAAVRRAFSGGDLLRQQRMSSTSIGEWAMAVVHGRTEPGALAPRSAARASSPSALIATAASRTTTTRTRSSHKFGGMIIDGHFPPRTGHDVMQGVDAGRHGGNGIWLRDEALLITTPLPLDARRRRAEPESPQKQPHDLGRHARHCLARRATIRPHSLVRPLMSSRSRGRSRPSRRCAGNAKKRTTTSAGASRRSDGEFEASTRAPSRRFARTCTRELQEAHRERQTILRHRQ